MRGAPIGPIASGSSSKPRLVGTDEMNHLDIRLEVTVGRNILVVTGWGNIVGEAQAVVVVLEVHVDQTLVSSVERGVLFCHLDHSFIIA